MYRHARPLGGLKLDGILRFPRGRLEAYLARQARRLTWRIGMRQIRHMPKRHAKEAPPMVVTTISLTADELKALKHVAVERGTTLRDLVREALAPLLKDARRGVRR